MKCSDDMKESVKWASNFCGEKRSFDKKKHFFKCVSK